MVHADSVISPWIRDYHPDFFSSLTSMENHCYSSGKEDWQIQFKSLNSAINKWAISNRQDVLSSLIPSIYSYKMLADIYNTESSAISSGALHAHSVFDMGGFISSVLSRPVDHFDDLKGEGINAISKKMSDDISLLHPSMNKESDIVASLIKNMNATIQAQTISNLFSTQPPPGSFVGKTGMSDFIFNTLEYKKVFTYLNVGSLKIPSELE